MHCTYKVTVWHRLFSWCTAGSFSSGACTTGSFASGACAAGSFSSGAFTVGAGAGEDAAVGGGSSAGVSAASIRCVDSPRPSYSLMLL